MRASRGPCVFRGRGRAALAAGAVFLFAWGVRLLWVGLVESPFDNDWSDMGGYIHRALHLAIGERDGAPQFASMFPPGTHYLLAAEMMLVGYKHHAAFLALHCMWGAAVAPCGTLLAARVVPRAWLAVAFGLLVAVWQPLLVFCGYFSSEQFDAGLLAVGSWLLVRHLETGRSAIALGVSTALAYLVRPPVLLTVVLLAAVALVVALRKPARAPRLRPWRLALAGGIVALAVVFGAVRYRVVTGRTGLISDNSAMMRLFADTDYGKVRSSNEGFFFEQPAKVQTGERRELAFPGYVGLSEPVERARRQEVRRMKLSARVLRFASNVSLLFARNEVWPEMSHLRQPWRRAFNDASKGVLLAVVCPLALLGAISCAWRPRTALVVAVAQVLTAMLVAGFFYGEARYRVPYDVFLLLLALEGGRCLVSVAIHRVRRWRDRRPAAVPSTPVRV